MALLELRGVAKHYPKGSQKIEVLRDLDLDIEQGELVAIVGPSGAGKSTLVSLIAGLMMPDAGTIRFRGQLVRGPSSERGVVFQSYSLLPWLTVLGNVLLGVEQSLASSSREKQRRHAERYLAMVGLSAALEKRPTQLSGGMRQRVALARALAMEPEILLLDEPLSALDALTRANLQTELDHICRSSGKTILLVTNDVDEGLLLADRIVPLRAGPRATLGESFVIDLPRPRQRRALVNDPRWRALRSTVIEALTNASARHEGAHA